MKKIAILGAGYMGSAMTFPLAQNKLDINLWGTWLDDDIIDSCLKGVHPKLNKKLPGSVKLFHSPDLKKAITDVDIIVIGISSDGFLDVFEKVLDAIDRNYYFFTLTKGFIEHNKKIHRTSKIAEEFFNKKTGNSQFQWTSIGGPVKAVEICRFIPTISVYGSKDSEMKKMAGLFSTPDYRIITTEDVAGLELCSAFKNVYSMTMGMLDGIYTPGQEGMYHNFSSLVFNQSTIEISKIVAGAGGDPDTVSNFAGIGDLYTTSQSGRNRLFGELLGKGAPPGEVYNKMLKSGQLAEGYHTLKHGIHWLKARKFKVAQDLPLFSITYDIIFKNKDPLDELKKLLDIYKNG